MFLDYFSLVILIMGLLLLFYGFIYIHDIPHEIAKHRNHPHTEAIHVACWLSLFTLHAIWPIVYIWAVYKARPIKVSIVPEQIDNVQDCQRQIDLLNERMRQLQAPQAVAILPEAPKHD